MGSLYSDLIVKLEEIMTEATDRLMEAAYKDLESAAATLLAGRQRRGSGRLVAIARRLGLDRARAAISRAEPSDEQ